jgi:uncharacterized protein YprB with RNaseH-like and TPR domain
MNSLAERLRALGVKTGFADIPAPKPLERYEIEAVVAGIYRPTPLGEVFVAEQTFAETYLHGEAPIWPNSPFTILAGWAHDDNLYDLPLESYAFLDTETSGLSGGTGTYAFLVGAGRFIEGRFVLQQFFMRDPAEEPALLEGLAAFLATARALVTFNGKAFDAPLLRTRYSLHGMPLPFKGYSHLDLLPLARRLWRDRLPSRALKYVEEHVLGMVRTADEVPGYEIPWLYFDYLCSGDARPLAGVFYHNAMDVVALAALLAHTSEMMAKPYDGRVMHGLDFIALGRLFEDLGHWEEAARLYERGLESELVEADFGLAVKRLSILQKRRGDLEQALRLWEQAAADGHLYAHVELAKYYEHRQRDVKAALKWTKSAKKKIEKTELPEYACKYWRAELEHRLSRLERKAGL